MKLLFALLTSLALAGTVQAEAVVKEVCTPKVDKAGKPVIDKKTKKQAEECKKVKTHKKVEGDKVPDGKKK
jgi:hypothetical protein